MANRFSLSPEEQAENSADEMASLPSDATAASSGVAITSPGSSDAEEHLATRYLASLSAGANREGTTSTSQTLSTSRVGRQLRKSSKKQETRKMQPDEDAENRFITLSEFNKRMLKMKKQHIRLHMDIQIMQKEILKRLDSTPKAQADPALLSQTTPPPPLPSFISKDQGQEGVSASVQPDPQQQPPTLSEVISSTISLHQMVGKVRLGQIMEYVPEKERRFVPGELARMVDTGEISQQNDMNGVFYSTAIPATTSPRQYPQPPPVEAGQNIGSTTSVGHKRKRNTPQECLAAGGENPIPPQEEFNDTDPDSVACSPLNVPSAEAGRNRGSTTSVGKKRKKKSLQNSNTPQEDIGIMELMPRSGNYKWRITTALGLRHQKTGKPLKLKKLRKLVYKGKEDVTELQQGNLDKELSWLIADKQVIEHPQGYYSLPKQG